MISQTIPLKSNHYPQSLHTPRHTNKVALRGRYTLRVARRNRKVQRRKNHKGNMYVNICSSTPTYTYMYAYIHISFKNVSHSFQTTECITKTENGNYQLPIMASDVFYSKDAERAFRREPIIIDTVDGPDKCAAPPADILNHCMYRHANTSMLGKGTFIIRRATNKPPTAMDIFRNDAEELDGLDTQDPSDYEEFSSIEGHENCKPNDALSSSSRHHSGDLVAPLGPTLPSPRYVGFLSQAKNNNTLQCIYTIYINTLF